VYCPSCSTSNREVWWAASDREFQFCFMFETGPWAGGRICWGCVWKAQALYTLLPCLSFCGAEAWGWRLSHFFSVLHTLWLVRVVHALLLTIDFQQQGLPALSILRCCCPSGWQHSGPGCCGTHLLQQHKDAALVGQSLCHGGAAHPTPCAVGTLQRASRQCCWCASSRSTLWVGVSCCQVVA
jgi:hypothetical protein